MLNSKKFRYLAVAGIAVAIVILVVVRGALHTEPPRYITEVVAIADIEKAVLASGELEPLELVEVGAQASGQIQKLSVDLGDKVKKGQVIAVIDPANQINTLRNAQAQLAQQKAQRLAQEATLLQDELALKRQAITVEADASSRADFEAAEATMKSARASLAVLDAEIEQAQVSVDRAKVDLSYTNIAAPMDGIVVAIIAKQGQTVNAVQSAPTIVKIANLDTMTVKAQISEADVINIRPGQEVYFTILGAPEHRYNATLREVEPAPDSIKNSSTATTSSSSTSSSSSSAVYYNGLFDVGNSGGELRTSMTAQVSIVLARAPQAVVIPAAALGAQKSSDTYDVRVLDEKGAVSPRQVRVGINNNTQVQILSGLKPGEKVIVGEGAAQAPPVNLQPGMGQPRMAP